VDIFYPILLAKIYKVNQVLENMYGDVLTLFRLKATRDVITFMWHHRWNSNRYFPEENIDLISFVIHERPRAIFSPPVPHTSHPVFLRIYCLEDVASEIFQGLISPGIALLIQDWEMLHSLLKLFECDSRPNLRKMQDVAKCRTLQKPWPFFESNPRLYQSNLKKYR